MESSLKSSSNKSDSRSIGKEENDSQKLSTRSILSAIGSKLFSGIQQPEVKKSDEKQKEDKKCEEQKLEIEEKRESTEKKAVKEIRKPKTKKTESVDDSWKRCDRDFLKFKTKYNNSMGNIMRSWMGLIYCILILRLNLIKFVQENLSSIPECDLLLEKQLEEENFAVFKMIRKAQSFSQERSLFLWLNLEKLVHSRMVIKNGLEVMRARDANKDWKGAATKLAQAEEELMNAKHLHETLMENAFNEEVSRLENLSATKGRELDQLITQISILKKREVQMRGRILLNMKNYKDLNNKRKYLLNLQKEMNQLKTNQTDKTNEYANQIQSIQSRIDDSEKQIKQEKEEIKKLRASLDVMGDVSAHSVAVNET